jgi:hypothetical protein
MNQSGTLKITHKARVKFSTGNYVDTVDCDIAPMSACHLLLGRPWQFDLDATHGGRSNNYSFVHKGVHHVLKPMLESAIRVDVFATLKVKKKVADITPKPRTALLQEGENNVITPAAGSMANSTRDVPGMITTVCTIEAKVSDIAVDNSLEPVANQLHSSYDKAGESKKSVSAHMTSKTLNEVV